MVTSFSLRCPPIPLGRAEVWILLSAPVAPVIPGVVVPVVPVVLFGVLFRVSALIVAFTSSSSTDASSSGSWFSSGYTT